MKQEKDGKTLYHIQSWSDWFDEPYDIFVWAKQQGEITSKLKKLYRDDYGDIDDEALKDLVKNTNIYIVYAEEI